MPELAFAQSERPSYLRPILVAVAAIAIAVALGIHFFPSKAIHLTPIRTDILPTHTVFKRQSIQVSDQEQDSLYVVAHLRVDNPLSTPIFLKDFTATFTDPEGFEINSSAVEQRDIPNALLSFPALKPLVGTPLLRESTIAPGASAEGSILFQFPIKLATWDTRKSAVLTLSTYHQAPVTMTIPNGTAAPAVVSK